MIDSDVLIDVLRGKDEAVAWFSQINSVQTISGISALELLFGSQDATELNRVKKILKAFSN